MWSCELQNYFTVNVNTSASYHLPNLVVSTRWGSLTFFLQMHHCIMSKKFLSLPQPLSDPMIIFRHCVQESWGAELHKDLKVTKEIREKEIDILWWDFLTWLQNPIDWGTNLWEDHHKECHHSSLQLRIQIWSGSPLWSSYSQGSQPRHWLLLGVLWQRKTRQDKPWGVDQKGGVSQSW